LASEDNRVAIVAVDPSSPFTGGALLGDRVRMQNLADNKNIFIRSMASRGNLGGLASTTSAVITIFDAAQFEFILVETIGAGQAEVSIANAAHTTLVVQAPGFGDEVQKIKAGILEIADILLVNKADRPGALRTVRALESMLHMGRSRNLGNDVHQGEQEDSNGEAPIKVWLTPVVQTVAVEGLGIEEVLEQIRLHRVFLKTTDEWVLREMQRSQNELQRLVQSRFMTLLMSRIPQKSRDQLVMALVRREIDPYTAASRLFEEFGL
jgi:LAO/AO transport system kinase